MSDGSVANVVFALGPNEMYASAVAPIDRTVRRADWSNGAADGALFETVTAIDPPPAVTAGNVTEPLTVLVAGSAMVEPDAVGVTADVAAGAGVGEAEIVGEAPGVGFAGSGDECDELPPLHAVARTTIAAAAAKGYQ